MTRINSAITPIELCNQMLIAEAREIKRIPNAIKKKIAEGKPVDLSKQPKQFKLGTGHVVFYYDKLGYLHNRYKSILAECKDRGFKMQDYNESFEGIPSEFYKDWKPTKDVRGILVDRINERLATMKRINWYSDQVTLDDAILSR